ncbi:MAG: alpha-glucan family phosphorylase [Acidobacteria bacterium]|nr:alpha-glucan family phosphorylase [Acidobacteriota bacterium]
MMITEPIEKALPARINRLYELAHNLWWSWHPNAVWLFQYLDKTLWELTYQNPVKLMQMLPQARFEAVATDPAFLRYYDGIILAFDKCLSGKDTWFSEKYPDLGGKSIAYFCAEFGLHISLPIYSGGLGILAGDHCKEAGDLGLPLVGVGFVYPQGYFRQKINSEGRQEAIYEQFEYQTAPIEPVFSRDSEGGLLQLHLDGRIIYAAVWSVRLGQVSLYLMDTDVDENEPWDRELSARLYGGDQQTRIRQELVLGIGGVRMLDRLGIRPSVYHANEGHAAFMLLERLRVLVQQGKSFKEAVEQIRDTTLFTTHTPVPAGHDAFPFHLVEHHFEGYWDQLGLDRQEFLALGEYPDGHGGKNFNMTALALRLSGMKNGVSQLHGKVSRQMWHSMWPESSEDEVPITSVTNGVHTQTWIAPEMDKLYSRHLSRDWRDNHDDPMLWERIDEIPDEELWKVHQQLKHNLFNFMRERARLEWINSGAGPVRVLTAGTLLDPDALTIGFARRFATYKRALLIFHDIDRLKRMLHDEWRPVQFVFAGKAHPADAPGKSLIAEVNRLARDHGLGGKIAFIENYDIHVAKHLVRGADVWLNNPRPPLEASGTSGQKAAINGVPHLSILDGWWYEGYNGTNGWAIDPGVPDDAPDDVRDAADAEALYQALENEVVPLYFDRDSDGIPRRWLQVVKEAIRTNTPAYSARRMVKEYAERFYVPAMKRESTKQTK